MMLLAEVFKHFNCIYPRLQLRMEKDREANDELLILEVTVNTTVVIRITEKSLAPTASFANIPTTIQDQKEVFPQSSTPCTTRICKSENLSEELNHFE